MPYNIKQVSDNLSNCNENIKLLIEDLASFANTGFGVYNLNMLHLIKDQITTYDINQLRTAVKTTKEISEIIEKIIDQEERRRKWINELAILKKKEDKKKRKREVKEDMSSKRLKDAENSPYALRILPTPPLPTLPQAAANQEGNYIQAKQQ